MFRGQYAIQVDAVVAESESYQLCDLEWLAQASLLAQCLRQRHAFPDLKLSLARRYNLEDSTTARLMLGRKVGKTSKCWKCVRKTVDLVLSHGKLNK